MSDSPDPDDLSAFAPELSDSTSGVRTDSGEGEREDDWLAVFTKEPRPDTTPGARDAALASPDEDLLQFPPDEYLTHSPDDDGVFLDQFPEQAPVPLPPPPPVHVRSEPWAGPWAAAVVAVVISVLLGTRSLYPAWWNAGAVPSAPLQVSTPAVEPGIPSQMFGHLEVVSVDAPRLASARVPATQSEVASSAPVAPRSALTVEMRPNARAARVSPPAVLVAERAARVPTVELMPLAPIAIPSSSGAVRSAGEDATPVRPEATPTPAPTPKASEASVQEFAVRTALHSYEQAYEALDVAATAAVWPSVDRRALARAFDTLKYQGLNFKSCAITVMDATAIARCRGTLEIVRKIGSSMPLTAEQEWVFKMRRLGKDWKIDDVAASQEHGLVTQRPRTQG
jgi:hypothetical protein